MVAGLSDLIFRFKVNLSASFFNLVSFVFSSGSGSDSDSNSSWGDWTWLAYTRLLVVLSAIRSRNFMVDQLALRGCMFVKFHTWYWRLRAVHIIVVPGQAVLSLIEFLPFRTVLELAWILIRAWVCDSIAPRTRWFAIGIMVLIWLAFLLPISDWILLAICFTTFDSAVTEFPWFLWPLWLATQAFIWLLLLPGLLFYSNWSRDLWSCCRLLVKRRSIAFHWLLNAWLRASI